MSNEKFVMGLFRDEDQAVSAIRALESSSWMLKSVHGPFPGHRIPNALKLKKSPVGYFTLAGGILGFLTGMGLSIYTAIQWNIIVSGKPVIALIPFLIVGFEFTILFSVLGNILGMLTQARLPDYKGLTLYDSRCSGEHFGILASCEKGDEAGLTEFFQANGGETKQFE